MFLTNRLLTILWILSILLKSTPALSLSCQKTPGDDPLSYQDRGNYCEGKKALLYSNRSENIELISVQVEYSESNLLAENAKAKIQFYWPKYLKNPPQIVVRDLKDDRSFYWLDNVKSSWQPNQFNTFEWPLRTVIQPLGLHLDELGVVIRSESEPSNDQIVMPAILYHSTLPAIVEKYLFTFKLIRVANELKFTIYSEKLNKPVFISENRSLTNEDGNLSLEWNAQHASPGNYSLVLEGYFINPVEPIPTRTIHFYHQVSLK